MEVVGDPSFMTQAKFSAKNVQVSCQPTPSSVSEDGEEDQCTLLSLRMITSIHDRLPNDQLTYVPLKLFNAQRQVLDRVACHISSIRDAGEEFARCRESRRGRVP